MPRADPHALVNVQFGQNGVLGPATPQYTGPGVLSGGLNQWNLVTNTLNFFPSSGESASGIALSDANGAATSIKLSYSTPDSIYNDNQSLRTPIFAGTPQQNLLTSYMYADGNQNSNPSGHDGSGLVTLSGLNPGQLYELILDSVADIVGRETEFIVDGIPEIVSPSGNPLQGLGDTYAEYIVPADASGDIAITFLVAGGPNSEANLNGIQLLALPTNVPEPPPILIFAIFLTGFLIREAARRTKINGF